MLRTICFSILFIMIIGCSVKDKKELVITEDDKEALTYLKEVEWPKAYREQDTLLLDRILNDDLKW